MRRWKRYILSLVLVGPMFSLHSCSTVLGTSLRDAAVEGAANFVEVSTTELLDRWFGLNGQE